MATSLLGNDRIARPTAANADQRQSCRKQYVKYAQRSVRLAGPWRDPIGVERRGSGAVDRGRSSPPRSATVRSHRKGSSLRPASTCPNAQKSDATMLSRRAGAIGRFMTVRRALIDHLGGWILRHPPLRAGWVRKPLYPVRPGETLKRPDRADLHGGRGKD